MRVKFDNEIKVFFSQIHSQFLYALKNESGLYSILCVLCIITHVPIWIFAHNTHALDITE